MKIFPLKVEAILPQPNGNLTIEFSSISDDYPAYKSGQFITLIFEFNGQEVRRSYSFNSSPYINERLSVTVKRIDNGEVSRFLHQQLKVGDVINTTGPNGLFVYEPEKNRKRTVVLFAAGVGITPLYSILKTALIAENESKVILAYSNRSKDDALFYQDLKKWEEEFPNRLKIEWIYSSAKNLLKARLNRDYIIDLLSDYSIDDDIVFYTCGPTYYMDLCYFTLSGLGFPHSQIKKETFRLPEEEEDDDNEASPEEVDKNTYSVILKFQGVDTVLEVPYYQTVLEAGLEQGLPLPYSCKSGMCSTCISECTAGSVSMRYNEVLTDREVEEGRCLLCTSHPRENNTVIEVN